MRKWILSGMLIVLAFALDTAVLPVFFRSAYLPPLSLSLSAAVGIAAGPIAGILTGLVAGLLSDIASGVMGDLLFAAIAAGGLCGALIRSRGARHSVTWKNRAYRGAMGFALFALIESAILFYGYYQIGRFEWVFLRLAMIRALLGEMIAFVLAPVCAGAIYGTWRSNKKKKKSAGGEKTF